MSLYPALQNPLVRAPKWWLVDAHGHHVGRLASQLPKLLQGKYKPSWNPSVDCGDYVVIINAKHVKFTGKKWTQKYYKWHTGWVGGLKQRSAKVMLQKEPEMIMRKAITRMMKKTALRARYEKRLLIYPDAVHPHVDQTLSEFNPVASENPVGMPRYDPLVDTDYSLRVVSEPDSPHMEVQARIFKPRASKAYRLQRKAAGHFGKGPTVSPLKSMYPGTFMLGPALTHAEWKQARAQIAAGTKPASWPATDPIIDNYVKQHIQTSREILQAKKSVVPRKPLTSAALTWAEAQSLTVTPAKPAGKK